METIRNPIEWTAAQLRDSARHIGAMGGALVDRRAAGRRGVVPSVRRIDLADLRAVLSCGIDDFAAFRSDVVFICVIYPLAGLLLVHLAVSHAMLPLVFPMLSGFALVGPFLAVVLYEMSRRREQALETNWADAFGIVRSPAIGAIFGLGVLLAALFGLWLLAAQAIYMATLGPAAPLSIAGFARDVLTTGAGWTMIVVGIGVGFCFATAALAISVVSFPLLIDRHVGLRVAILTSIRAVWANPVPMAVWGLIVATALVIGSLPLLLGLIVVFPVLGHATWHLYRRLIA